MTKRYVVVFLALLLAFVATCGGRSDTWSPVKDATAGDTDRTAPLALPASPSASPAANDPLRRTPIVVAVERATPAVVTVRVEIEASSPFVMFGEERRASEGSGVIIHANGTVLTNAHVVDGARKVEVHLDDGRTFPAEVVARDPALDLAVLRLRGAAGLPVIQLGDSATLLLGEPAIAIGNPFGLGLTVSTGVISSTGRDMDVGQGTQTYIQTDAAINPGNSGGALVNVHGELIGINTFIHAAGEGIGFAIPVNRARKIADDLLAYGAVQLPWLGTTLLDVPRRRLEGDLAEGALLVRQVYPTSPAAAAGLAPGDLVLSVDGHRVATRADLNARLAERAPGDTVRLEVARDRDRRTVEVVTAHAPATLGMASLQRVLGVEVRPVQGGLQVIHVAPRGTFAQAGLRAGDLILGVDGERTPTIDALTAALGRAIARHRPSAWFAVARGPYQGTIEIGI